MNLDIALVSDFVKWNKKAIHNNITSLECPQLWENEPLDCILQVVNTKYVNYEKRILLECTQNCGQHVFYELGRADYEDMSTAVGAEILGFVDSFAEVVANYCPEEEGYDFEEDKAELYKRIILGTLPVCRKEDV